MFFNLFYEPSFFSQKENFPINRLVYLNGHRISGDKHRPLNQKHFIFDFYLNEEIVKNLQDKNFKFNRIIFNNDLDKNLLNISFVFKSNQEILDRFDFSLDYSNWTKPKSDLYLEEPKFLKTSFGKVKHLSICTNEISFNDPEFIQNSNTSELDSCYLIEGYNLICPVINEQL